MERKDILDTVDRNLLRLLQEDGRMTNQELARRCNLSPAACFERVKRLRAAGTIQSYTALIDPVQVGRELMIFVEVILDRASEDAFAIFAEHVHRIPDVMECHMVAGAFDYLLKVRISGMTAYRGFLGDILAGMPGVRETRTYAVIEEVKATSRLPI